MGYKQGSWLHKNAVSPTFLFYFLMIQVQILVSWSWSSQRDTHFTPTHILEKKIYLYGFLYLKDMFSEENLWLPLIFAMYYAH